MICYVILLINSIVLEGLLSNVFSNVYLFFLLAVAVIGLSYNNVKRYLLITIPFLIMYDIIYTSSFFLNTIIILSIVLLLYKFKIKTTIKYIISCVLYTFIISRSYAINHVIVLQSTIINILFFMINYLIYFLYIKLISYVKKS